MSEAIYSSLPRVSMHWQYNGQSGWDMLLVTTVRYLSQCCAGQTADEPATCCKFVSAHKMPHRSGSAFAFGICLADACMSACVRVLALNTRGRARDSRALYPRMYRICRHVLCLLALLCYSLCSFCPRGAFSWLIGRERSTESTGVSECCRLISIPGAPLADT